MPRLKPASYSAAYDTLSADSRAMGEARDCAVVALAAACGVSYAVAHAAQKAAGRIGGKGTHMHITIRAAASLGFNIRRWPFLAMQAKIDSYPIKAENITTHHPHRLNASWKDEGTLLFRTKDHILCVKDGVNLDWSVKTSLRVCEIYQVTPICDTPVGDLNSDAEKVK